MSLDLLVESLGLNTRWVSERTGIPLARLNEISDGATPTRKELAALSDSLGVPPDQIIAPPDAQQAQLLLRSTVKKGSSDSLPFVNELSRIMELLPRIEIGMPAWLTGFQSRMTASEAAKLFRDRFYSGDQLSPVVSLPGIVDELPDTAVLVTRSRVDGGAALARGRALIFVGARSFGPRMLFTLAHEVGHLVLHFANGIASAHVDKRIQLSPGKKKSIEWEANLFAMELLMPEEAVIRGSRHILSRSGKEAGEVMGDLEINLLARFFGVSFEAACFRLENLKLLPRAGAVSMVEKIRKTHKSPEKRGDEGNLPERMPTEFPALPRLLLETSAELIQQGKLSVGRAASLMNSTTAEVFQARSKSTAPSL